MMLNVVTVGFGQNEAGSHPACYNGVMKEFDIAIVGAGVAGMTAAIYGLRAKKSVVVFEKVAAGGQILETTKIANYPGVPSVTGGDLARTLAGQVQNFGGEIKLAEVLAVKREGGEFKVETDDEPVLARTVIIANGSRERRMGIPREKELTGKGVSYCATCDGALYRDKAVAVYGGGNTAAYSVMYLAGICKKVFWIFRKPEPRAEKHLVEKVKEMANVEIIPSVVITGLRGEEKLEGLELDNRSGVDVEALFVSIGREPDNAKFKGLVELDGEGYVKAGEDCQTSCAGVFVAGDTRAKKLHQIVTATADGAVAASAAVEYINSHGG